jgi:16S rRNA (cytosine1402-N4)-methyltransferase
MTADPGVATDAGGGPARHVPVLLAEMLDVIRPESGKLIVDGTFGAGGYAAALLDRGASVVAIDRDPDAVAAGQAMVAASGGRLRLVAGAFSDLDRHAGGKVDGVVLDVGVSSMQLDEAGRGFSFRQDGPLDMRMSRAGLTAADVVNTFKAGDLARIFGFLGEEKHAGRIARMIERRRAVRRFETTRDLAGTIETLLGHGARDRIHPATRVFQALRVFVNDELGELANALFAAERALKPGGRLAVISFHSIEDRIVKRFIADRSQSAGSSRHMPAGRHEPPTFEKAGRVVTPGPEELQRNPRARSAKLRGAVRGAEPARPADPSIFALPKLPERRFAEER